MGRLRFVDLLKPASAALFERVLPGFKQQGHIAGLEYELVRKDGTPLPVLMSATAVKDAAGRFLMSRAVLVDLSARRRAEERLGGDEFAVVLDELEHVSVAVQIATRIQHQLRAAFDLDGRVVNQTASIGIALSGASQPRPMDLLHDADVAVSRARVLGRGRSVVFGD